MGDLPLLSEAQMRRIEPYFPLSRGRARVDDRRVLSGIVYVIRNGLMWRDAPPGYGPPKTLYNRFVRWSRAGVFNRIFAGLAAEGDHDHASGHAFAAAPDLTHVFSLEVLVGEPWEQGLVDGRRLRFVPITGGRVVGPRLTGDILPGGGDWQSIHPDGLTEVKARYAIRADDGIVIDIANPGVRVASADVSDRLARGEVVDPSLYYFRTGPRFLVADGPHGWLRRTQFVGVGIRRPREVEIRVFAIG